MRLVRDHSVEIGDSFKCRASQVKLPQPLVEKRRDKFEIDEGPTMQYGTGYELRQMTFQSKVYGTPIDVLEELDKIKGRQRFVSIYIGAFDAIITVKPVEYIDGSPGWMVVDFTIDEVE